MRFDEIDRMSVAEFSNYLYGLKQREEHDIWQTRELVIAVYASQNPKHGMQIRRWVSKQMPLSSDTRIARKPNLTKEEYLASIPFLKKVMNAKPEPNRSIA